MHTLRKKSIAFAALAVVFIFSSCKKDEPFVKPKLSLAKATMSALESDKTIDVEFMLDRSYSGDIKITYTLKGTATDKAAAGKNPYDYEMLGTYLEATIKAGETTGKAQIKVYSDLSFEDDETIILTIKNTDTEDIEITRQDEIEITLAQEDGIVVLLQWPTPSTAGQADMDIILWAGSSISKFDGIIGASDFISFAGPELLIIPKAIEFSAYGLGYVYYDGTLNPLDFTVTFIDFAGGVVEPKANQQEFKKSYTLGNLNKWTDANTTQVVQTIQKTSTGFSSPSDITVPVSGSRISGTPLFPSEFTRKKSRNTIPAVLQSYLQ